MKLRRALSGQSHSRSSEEKPKAQNISLVDQDDKDKGIAQNAIIQKDDNDKVIKSTRPTSPIPVEALSLTFEKTSKDESKESSSPSSSQKKQQVNVNKKVKTTPKRLGIPEGKLHF